MTTEEQNVLVFKDQAGEYYLLPQATLQQGRVPAEQKAQIEEVIAEQQDVQGHWFHFLIPAAVITTGVVLVVREISQQNTVEQAPLPGPGGIPTGSPETISTGGGPQRI